VLSALRQLAFTASEFDALERASPKLVAALAAGGPNGASAPDKLVVVVKQMGLIYGGIEEEFDKYLALDFEHLEPRDRERLAKLARGETRARLPTLRGHCKEIVATYERYLRPWFEHVLSADEVMELDRLFRQNVAGYDHSMMEAIEELAGWIESEAEGALRRVESGDFEAANRRRREAHKEILPDLRTMRSAFGVLGRLEEEFVPLS
jgi:hypothetical protein